MRKTKDSVNKDKKTRKGIENKNKKCLKIWQLLKEILKMQKES
jgi:hypothetical protein